MCPVHHLNMCTDVYLQGSWLRNEKIAGSCLLADVKAVSRTFSCVALTLERSKHDGGRYSVSFCNCIILPRLFRFLVEEVFSG